MSETELEIMEFLWLNNVGTSLKEICNYFNGEVKKDWKQQTVRSFLLRLKDKGYVNIYMDTKTKKYVYLPSLTKEDYLQGMTQNVLNKFFNDSIYNFLSAFSGGKKLNQESAKELKKFLSEIEDE